MLAVFKLSSSAIGRSRVSERSYGPPMPPCFSGSSGVVCGSPAPPVGLDPTSILSPSFFEGCSLGMASCSADDPGSGFWRIADPLKESWKDERLLPSNSQLERKFPLPLEPERAERVQFQLMCLRTEHDQPTPAILPMACALLRFTVSKIGIVHTPGYGSSAVKNSRHDRIYFRSRK